MDMPNLTALDPGLSLGYNDFKTGVIAFFLKKRQLMSYSNSARWDSYYHVCYFQDDMLVENAATGNAVLSKCIMGKFLFVAGRYKVNKLFYN